MTCWHPDACRGPTHLGEFAVFLDLLHPRVAINIQRFKDRGDLRRDLPTLVFTDVTSGKVDQPQVHPLAQSFNRAFWTIQIHQP